MSRIRKAYEQRFRALLQQMGARRADDGVRWLLGKVERVRRDQSLPPAQAFARVHAALAGRRPRRPAAGVAASRFLCDAGLGGLARWLRAAGYDAGWDAGIDDDELVRVARSTGATLLTTDSLLMERRLLRDGIIPALWVPSTLTIAGQLALVLRELGLPVRPPRCMSCGGELRPVPKEQVRERIPPKTARWLDDYFVCARCGKLFWHGTHWERIERQLRSLTG